MTRAEWAKRVQNLKIVARWQSTLPMVTNDALIRTVEHILDNWQWEVEQLCGDMQALQAETARMKKEIAEADAEVRDLTNQVVLFGRTE